MLNHKPQFQHVNISTNKTIIFNNNKPEFTLIEQTKKQTTAEETKTLLNGREDFWVVKIKCPDGLNKKLNKID